METDRYTTNHFSMNFEAENKLISARQIKINLNLKFPKQLKKIKENLLHYIFVFKVFTSYRYVILLRQYAFYD